MNSIIDATTHTLLKAKSLLNTLSDDELRNDSVPPYYSCVGSHIRHILDFFDCILEGIESGEVDLTARRRDLRVEQQCDFASESIDRVVSSLRAIGGQSDAHVNVTDDLGLGKTTIKQTVSGLLAQANSHTIHHYAIISYILDHLNVQVEDETFGYNPTSPVKTASAT